MYSHTVEIGHTYAPDRLGPFAPEGHEGRRAPGYDRVFTDSPEAARLRALAQDIGDKSLVVALVDDVAVRERQRNSDDPWRWQAFIDASKASVVAATGAEIVEYESAFALRARDMVEEIRTMELPTDYRLSETGNKLIFGSGKTKVRIPLVGFGGVDDPTHPSCQMLDLAWLEHKLSLAPDAITVLPQGYEEQQEQVRLLADLFPQIDQHSIESRFIA